MTRHGSGGAFLDDAGFLFAPSVSKKLSVLGCSLEGAKAD